MENEKKRSNTWLIVLLVLIILGLVGYICYDKFFAKESKPVLTNGVKQVLYDNTSYGEDVVDIVELTKGGSVLVTIKSSDSINVDSKEVLSNVDQAFKVKTGVSDICEGNTKLIFIMKDSTISYLDIDELVCGNSIKVVNNFASLNNIVNIVKEEKLGECDKDSSYCEPSYNIVYAIDKDGNKINISEKFN